MFKMLKKFWNYLFSKRKEVKELDKKDIFLAKFMIDAGRNKRGSEFFLIPLNDIDKIHIIDRENAVSKLNERITVIEENKTEIREKKNIDREFLGKYLPSISWIKVIKRKDNTYIAFEGNGRLEAFKKVFDKNDNLNIEVEVYTFRSYKKMLRRAERVRKYNGITGE
ncbi:hypothetical protein [Sebaldella sp. S0638]|uniref:hypothetical protein n=1 Tax=Sebaldella sp. S0638 TaxID=2957809 RepID=UPI0020A1DB51|nr:hypothetical protein [Sebaldella sp. S0638]MCP1223644.1 hypothetical protein [Sebaldella sp. S0638]